MTINTFKLAFFLALAYIIFSFVSCSIETENPNVVYKEIDTTFFQVEQ